MRCLASFLRELCRFSLSACSVSVRVSYAGLKRIPPYPDVRPAPLVRLLCPPDEPHAMLSQPFLHSWGQRAPARPGSALSAGSLLLPGDARRRGRGRGWAVRAPGPLAHLSWETKCAHTPVITDTHVPVRLCLHPPRPPPCLLSWFARLRAQAPGTVCVHGHPLALNPGPWLQEGRHSHRCMSSES